MKVCGFTIVRNAVKYDYPMVESITSILPLCDEFIILAGNSEDSTLDLLHHIDSEKIRIIPSIWDDTLKEGGKVLAVETNKALDLIPEKYDWAFYLQADEVVHEEYHNAIYSSMKQFLDDKEVDGLLFNYTHFYGTYNYVADSRKWYRNEIRVIRNDKSIRSYRDAQGFRKNGKKLRVKPVDAFIYHYGWVKNPKTMQTKMLDFHRLWHDEKWIEKNFKSSELFDYSEIDSLKLFDGTHPAVMTERINNTNWNIRLDISNRRFNLKERFFYHFEKISGHRLFEYKNYSIIK